MLIKYRDRLTADSILALNNFIESGETHLFQEIIELIQNHQDRTNQLPFPKKAVEALHVRQYDENGFVRELDYKELRTLFKGTKIRAISPVADLRADAVRWEELLKSEASHQLAFTNEPLIYGEGGKFWISFIEGKTGSKYARTKDEILDFLQTHPDVQGLFSDIALMTNFEKEIHNLDELETFIDENPQVHLEFVISRLDLMSGHFFGSYGEEIGKQQSHILALNAEAFASFDILLFPEDPNSKRVASTFKEARQRLEDSLKAIVAFAARKNIPEQAGYFAMGLKVLSGEAAPVLAPFWQPPQRPVEAGILYCAATNADDFAGMESWNDAQIEQDEEFRRVSNAVAFAILESVCAAVND